MISSQERERSSSSLMTRGGSSMRIQMMPTACDGIKPETNLHHGDGETSLREEGSLLDQYIDAKAVILVGHFTP